MKDLFKYYIDSKDNQDLRDTLNIQLAKYGISVSERKYFHQIYNRYSGDYSSSSFPSYTYTVFYNNKKVAEFNNEKYNEYPNLEKYANKFVPGEWPNDFNIAIEEKKIWL